MSDIRVPILPASPVDRRGMMFVLSSPSGAGKTSISRALLEHDDNLSMSVSVTTRPPRPGEEDGREYFFRTEPEFKGMVEAGGLLEHAEVFGNFYGTPRTAVEEQLAKGRDVLFDIDWQGTQQIAAKSRDDLVSIFILPPGIEVLETRLRGRAQDSDEVIAGRMAKAADEMSHWPEYDYVVINDDLDRAIAGVVSILNAERHRRRRLVGLVEFVNKMRST